MLNFLFLKNLRNISFSNNISTICKEKMKVMLERDVLYIYEVIIRTLICVFLKKYFEILFQVFVEQSKTPGYVF